MEPIAASRSAVSERHAIVSEGGDSVWLYLTERDGQRPERDCWLFNTPASSAGHDPDYYRARGLAPPAPERLLTASAVRDPDGIGAWDFHWSPDGTAVAVAADGEPLGLVSIEHPRGFSRLILESSPWASVWQPDLFQQIAGVEA